MKILAKLKCFFVSNCKGIWISFSFYLLCFVPMLSILKFGFAVFMGNEERRAEIPIFALFLPYYLLLISSFIFSFFLTYIKKNNLMIISDFLIFLAIFSPHPLGLLLRLSYAGTGTLDDIFEDIYYFGVSSILDYCYLKNIFPFSIILSLILWAYFSILTFKKNA